MSLECFPGAQQLLFRICERHDLTTQDVRIQLVAPGHFAVDLTDQGAQKLAERDPASPLVEVLA